MPNVIEIMAGDMSQIIDLAKTNMKYVPQVVNVQGFGAKGDGITDDTQAVQSAINAAIANNATLVYFPPGTYKVTSLTNTSTINFVGDNATFSGYVGTILEFGVPNVNTKNTITPVVNVLGYGAKGDGVTDDTTAFKNAIAATPAGGTLYIPVGNYKLTDELTIAKPIHIMGSMAEDSGQTYLNFNLDSQAPSKVGIRINNQIHGCILQDFYMNYSGIVAHDGILFDGVAGNYPNYIWYSKLNGVYVRNFNNNFRFNNICIASVINCRSIAAKSTGFLQTGFATGLNYFSCYAQDSLGPGFQFVNSYYSGCSSCYSDGNARGFFFQNSYGGYVKNCGSESSVNYAVHCQNSSVNVDGITVVQSGTDQSSTFRPTVVYVESGYCDVKGVVEQSLPPSNTRLYTILFENGAHGTVCTCQELLDIRIPYDGSCAIDGQYLTQGVPTATGWKAKDIGKVVYNQNATEQGTAGSKYIIFGYRRMTAGNGNAVNTDWLPLRALTGN